MFTSSILMLLSLIMLIISMILMFNNMFIYMNLKLLSSIHLNIPISMILDWMSTLFMSVVMLISSMILMFSMYYIPKKEQNQFHILLLMFILSMILLILSDNIIFIILGWDGLGFSSYILVVYYQNFSSSASGSITIFSNRVGDIMILMSIGIMSMTMNWNFSLEKNFPIILMMMLMIAACTKSAQFPFSAWLPAAMAAPTPVSALVHSSTLVTAGVFLMIRTMNNFHPLSMLILMIISTITTLYSSMSAMWEQDMKKIIALSTLSQIAMMMFSISMKSPSITIFHLITHALFKSTMFLCAGTMIHNSSYQDMRHMGSMFMNSPISNFSLGLTSMALMGIPFTSGFFSKDMIIENMISSKLYSLMTFIMLLSITMTASYSIRMMISSTKFYLKSNSMTNIHQNFYSNLSISIMTPLSIFMGTMMIWIMPINQFLHMPIMMKIMIPSMVILGIMISMSYKFKNKNHMNLGMPAISLWFMNFLTTNLFSKTFKYMMNLQKTDSSWQENYGPQTLFLQNKMMSKLPDNTLNIMLFSLIIIIIIPMLMLT